MSSKQRSWTKGTLSTGTTGFGFIMFDPVGAAVNDRSSVWASDSSYAAGVTAISGAGVVATNSNSQYSSADIGATNPLNQFRVVGAGVRIRYAGTELNRGGFVNALADPTHSNQTGASLLTIRAEPEAKQFPVNREWTTVLYRPVFNDELNYQSDWTLAVPAHVIVVTAASAATPLTYEYECFTVHEFQGRSVKGMTPSHSDPTGFAAVNTTALTNPVLRPNQVASPNREKGALTSVAEYISRGTSSVATIAQDAAHAVSIGADIVSAGSKAWGALTTIAEVMEPLLMAL